MIGSNFNEIRLTTPYMRKVVDNPPLMNSKERAMMLIFRGKDLRSKALVFKILCLFCRRPVKLP